MDPVEVVQRRPVRAPALILIVGGAVAVGLWLAQPGSDEQMVTPVTEAQPPLTADEPASAAGTEPEPPAGRPGQSLAVATGENGAVIYDVDLASGERFRISLPVAMADELDSVVADLPPAPIVLTGPSRSEVRVEFTFCQEQEGMEANSRGSVVGRIDDHHLVFCRPDELLTTTVTTDLELTDQEVQRFDVRLINIGNRYPQQLVEVRTIGDCSNCFRYGPVRYGPLVVNQVGRGAVAAVRHDDLSTAWTYRSETEIALLDPGSPGTFHDPDEGLWLSEVGGSLLNLEPATGDVRWQVALDPDEGDVGLVGADQKPWLLWSSFTSEGDHRAPRLRRIDPDTGIGRWQVEGREGADWAWSPLVTTDELAIIVDVVSDPESSAPGQGSVIYAHDLETGRLVFTVDLEAPAGMLASRRLLEVTEIDGSPSLLASTTHGVLARIDLDNGDLLWVTRINPGVVRGVVELADGTWAIAVQTSPLGPYYLDAETGTRVVDSVGPGRSG